MSAVVSWWSLPWPGAEHVVWSHGAAGFRADGFAVTAFPDGPARVAYRLRADRAGRTRTVHVRVDTGRAGGVRRLALIADGCGRWRDGDLRHLPALDGCLDVDLSCTPLTNTLPVRRLGLAPGTGHDLLAAYVAFPGLTVHAVRQRYDCLDRDESGAIHRYSSGSFEADLRTDRDDLVLDYPGIWRRVTTPTEGTTP